MRIRLWADFRGLWYCMESYSSILCNSPWLWNKTAGTSFWHVGILELVLTMNTLALL